MKPSTYAVCRAELDQLLRAHPDLGAERVVYGDPGLKPPLECVSHFPGDPSNEKWGHIGNQTKLETFFLEVMVTVTLRGGTQRAATERCEELYAAVEHQLRTEPKISQKAAIAGVEVVAIVRTSRVEPSVAEGRAAATSALIEVQSRTRA